MGHVYVSMGHVYVSMGHVHMDFESFHALLKLLNKKVIKQSINIELVLHCSIMSKRNRNLSGTTIKRRCHTKERGSMMKEAAVVAWTISQYKGCLQLSTQSARNILASVH